MTEMALLLIRGLSGFKFRGVGPHQLYKLPLLTCITK